MNKYSNLLFSRHYLPAKIDLFLSNDQGETRNWFLDTIEDTSFHHITETYGITIACPNATFHSTSAEWRHKALAQSSAALFWFSANNADTALNLLELGQSLANPQQTTYLGVHPHNKNQSVIQEKVSLFDSEITIHESLEDVLRSYTHWVTFEYTRCDDCRRPLLQKPYSDYMVHNRVWDTATIKSNVYLCVECLEFRLSTQLTAKDFTLCYLNYEAAHNPDTDPVLKDRLKGYIENFEAEYPDEVGRWEYM